MSAVQQVVENSDFARKGLSQGLLNISAYAKAIHDEVEELCKKEIKNESSIVMALSRYGRQLQKQHYTEPDLKIQNIVSRSHLVEFAYTKTPEIQERLATLNLLESIKSAPFFVSTVGLAEVAIILDMSLADVVKGHFGMIQPLIQTNSLASLTMQVGIETIDMPGQSASVLGLLASRHITVVEYTTSPTELNIILYEKDVSSAYQLLHRTFLAQKSSPFA